MNKLQLQDVAAENIVLGSIVRYGTEIFYDIDTILSDQDFSLEANKIIFSVCKKLFNNGLNKIDITTILASIKAIDSNLIQKYELEEYIGAMTLRDVDIQTSIFFAKKLAKLSLGRQIRSKLNLALEDVGKISGEESVSEILSIAEKPIIQLTTHLINNENTVSLQETIGHTVEKLQNAESSQLGLPTGFERWDSSIGGGLRIPGNHMIVGRAKVGKSQMGVEIGLRVAHLGVPVLYLDTELTTDIINTRVLSNISGRPINELESGKFKTGDNDIKTALNTISKLPFYYHNISGKNHYEWISIIRRWLLHHVRLNENGHLNPCLVILDYIKIMDLNHLGNHAEWQILGQICTDLHNLCLQYNFPILSFGQANRDGITKQDQSIVAGSDRIVQLCSSLSIFAAKTAEDFAADPKINGDRKLIVIASRFGPGTEDGTYINVITDLSRCKLVEGNFNYENKPKLTYDDSNDSKKKKLQLSANKTDL